MTERQDSPTNRPRSRRAAAGFSLLELMVVCGVLAVLFGLAVGYLGKTDPTIVANSVVAGELRAARFTARTEGLPTEVIVTPGVDGQPATVRSRLLEPVVSFHFEPGEPVLDDSLRPTLGGEAVAHGRFGAGRRNMLDDNAPLLRWQAPPDQVDLRAGFALRLDLWLEERLACTVAILGGVLDLRLDDEGRPRARVRLTGGTETAAAVATVHSSLALPLRRWSTVDVAFDGRELWCTINGREVGRAPARGEPLQEENDVLDVSPGGDPVPGIVDEVRLFAYAFGPAQFLPKELQPDRVYRIGYDARGEALGSTEVNLLLPEEEQQ